MNRSLRTVVASFLAILLGFGTLAAPFGRGAVEQPKNTGIYVKIDGIPGGSSDEQHKGEIEALQFNWSAKQKDDGSAATSDLHDGLILKPIDVATPKLFVALASGTVIPQLVISVRGTVPGGKSQQEYLRYTFTDVRLTAVSHAIVNSAQEQVQFKYDKVTIRCQGADGQTVEEGWDVKAKQPIGAPKAGDQK